MGDITLDIKIDMEDMILDNESSLLESKIKDMLKDPRISYKGRNDTLIFQSKATDSTDLELSRKIGDAMTLIMAFTLEDKEKIRIKHWDRRLIKTICDDLGTIILEDDDIFLKLYVHVIFPLAIKSGDDYFVEHIIDKCVTHYNDNYNDSSALKILSIITSSFSKLHKSYPDYAKKFNSTLTIHGKHNLIISSDEHLQSYSPNFSEIGYLENFYRLIGPYIVNVIIYLAIFCVKTKGVISLIILGGVICSVLSLSDDIQELILHTRKKLHDTLKNLEKLKNKKLDSILPIENKNKRLSVNLFVPFPKLENDINYDNRGRSRDLYSDWNGEVLIKFKWDRFGKCYYYFTWHIFNCFFVSSILIIYPNYPKNLVISIINIILGCFLLSFEIRKFIFNCLQYMSNLSNYFNLVTYCLPILNSLSFAVANRLLPTWILAFSILLLHVKIILFLRTVTFFERYSVIIICVAKHIFSFLLILIFVTLAYADAFWVFLRDTPSKSDDNPNLFADYDTSVAGLYRIMFGDYGSLALWPSFGYKPEIAVLLGSFTFIVIIYLLNLFIGLLSNAIEETDRRELILAQKAEIIAEIELFWLLPCHRKREDLFPDIIFYNVPVNKLREKIKEIHDCNYSHEGYRPIIHHELLKLIGKLMKQ